jgi:hypothetical protein
MNAICKKLDSAKLLLHEALAHSEHAPECSFRKFRGHNSYLPDNHPSWKSAPACNCWRANVVNFLEGH